MAENPSWAPLGIDRTKASVARVYDWWLGGDHNFQVDQDAARALISVTPEVRAVARAYRAFLIRAVRYLAAEAGIRQFLDIGSGIPTAQNVHQVAHDIDPSAKVVYVDNDDVAVAHSRAILLGNPNATVIHGDLREPQEIIGHPETRNFLDFSRPVAVLLSSVVHFLPDSDHPAQIIETLRAPLAPGSYLVLSHGCRDSRPEMADVFASSYTSRVDSGVRIRTRDEISGFFKGFDLVEPGLVWLPEWRPDSPADVPEDPSSLYGIAGVGKYNG